MVPAAPPCLNASDDDAVEEEWLGDQMQEILEIDHAQAAMIDEPAREPKLIIVRFGCANWKDDCSVLYFVSDCQLVVDSWKRGHLWRVQKVAAH